MEKKKKFGDFYKERTIRKGTTLRRETIEWREGGKDGD